MLATSSLKLQNPFKQRKQRIVMLLLSHCHPEPRLEKEAKALLNTGNFEVFVIAWRRFRELKTFERKSGMIILRLDPPLPTRFNFFPLWMKVLIKATIIARYSVRTLFLCLRLKPRVIHAHDLHTLHIGVMVRCLKRITLLYDSHEDFPAMMKDSSSFLGLMAACIERVLCPFVDQVITVNELIAERFTRKLNRPVIVVKNFSEVDLMQKPQLALTSVTKTFIDQINQWKRDGYFIVLSVSLFSEHYGLDKLLEAKPHADAIAKIAYVLIGWGPQGEKLKAIQFHLCLRHVLFTGLIPREQLSYFLRLADLGVDLKQPTPYFNTFVGQKITEYMTAGLPVLAGTLPLVKELLDRGCGVTVDSTNPEAIGKALVQLATHRHLIGELAKRAFELSKQFTWESQAIRLLDLYHGINYGAGQNDATYNKYRS